MEADEIALFLSETLAGRYRPVRHLASGAFSGAFLAHDTDSGGSVAAKILKLSQAGRPEARQEFQGEVALLQRLDGCDRVIRLVGSGEHTVQLRHSASGGSIPVTTEYVVLELAAGSLADLIIYGSGFTWPDRLRLYRDVIKGVHQMHLRLALAQHDEPLADRVAANAVLACRSAGLTTPAVLDRALLGRLAPASRSRPGSWIVAERVRRELQIQLPGDEGNKHQEGDAWSHELQFPFPSECLVLPRNDPPQLECGKHDRLK